MNRGIADLENRDSRQKRAKVGVAAGRAAMTERTETQRSTSSAIAEGSKEGIACELFLRPDSGTATIPQPTEKLPQLRFPEQDYILGNRSTCHFFISFSGYLADIKSAAASKITPMRPISDLRLR
jgi:hypothetical protein